MADAVIFVRNALAKWRLIGVDAADAMLNIARRRGEGVPDLRFEKADFKSFEPDTPADAVVSNTVLHHLQDPADFWACVKRVGRSNAVVHVRDLIRPDSDELVAKLIDQYAANESATLREEFHRSLMAAWTVQEIGQQLEAAGLSTFTITPVSDRHADVVGRLP